MKLNNNTSAPLPQKKSMGSAKFLKVKPMILVSLVTKRNNQNKFDA